MTKSKKDERRHGDRVFRDGKMFHNYSVYDDGRIEMKQWRTATDHLIAQDAAIWDMEKSFERLVFERRRELQEALQRNRRDFHRELKMIDPTYDNDKWLYDVDNDGFVMKTARPEPAKDEDLQNPQAKA